MQRIGRQQTFSLNEIINTNRYWKISI